MIQKLILGLVVCEAVMNAWFSAGFVEGIGIYSLVLPTTALIATSSKYINAKVGVFDTDVPLERMDDFFLRCMFI